MIEHRCAVQARLEERMTETLVDGSALGLVTVCLTDDGAGEVSDVLGGPVGPRLPVVSHLRPGEARELAFVLLELAELAERRTGGQDEPE